MKPLKWFRDHKGLSIARKPKNKPNNHPSYHFLVDDNACRQCYNKQKEGYIFYTKKPVSRYYAKSTPRNPFRKNKAN